MPPLLEVTIEKMTLGGQGLTHIEGKACFVDRVIPGETVLVEIVQDKRDYSVARAREVVRASAQRVTPECPIYNRCGGCQLQHIAYPRQLELKREMFIETLKRIGKIDVEDVTVAAGAAYGYRNRAQLPVQAGPPAKIGYYKTGTHQVVDQLSCPINHPRINRVLTELRDRILHSKVTAYDEARNTGLLRHILIKAGVNTDQTFLTFVTTKPLFPESLYEGLSDKIPGLIGVTQNLNAGRTNRILGSRTANLWGRDHYEERIAGFLFRLRTASFFQVNIPVMGKMLVAIQDARSWASDETVLDLYAGVGVIGITLAKRVREVVAVEESAETVEDGVKSCQDNGIARVRFIRGDAATVTASIPHADIAILDPPRKGVEPAVLTSLADRGVHEILYVSCNPATLARDAAILQAGSFRLQQASVFDMFPQTHHIESLVLFTRG